MFKSGSQHRRKVTPPSPTYMKDDQFAAYLADLRNSRQSRPAGARELPATDSRRSRNRISMGSTTTTATFSTSASSAAPTIPDHTSAYAQSRQSATDASTVNGSVRSRYSTTSKARDYYPSKPTSPPKPSEIVPSTVYIERGQRWMEKEDAHSIRHAMEVLDHRAGRKSISPPPPASSQKPISGSIAASIPPHNEEEERVYNAALDEASELVWQHQHGIVPKLNAPYAYRPHLRRDSYKHARAAAAGLYGDDIVPSGLARDRIRSCSGSSNDSDYQPSRRSRRSTDSNGTVSNSVAVVDESCAVSPTDSAYSGPRSSVSSGKSYSGLNSGKYAPVPRRRSSMKRNISGEIDRPFSGEQIWEEPESRNSTPAKPAPAPVSSSSYTSLASPSISRITGPRPSASAPNSRPLPAPVTPYERKENEPLSRVEIHRNPPTQSRNPIYTRSDSSTPPPTAAQDMDIPRKNGVEIRPDDLRNATRIRLSKDRKIPIPSAVSNDPGRPIVSFDANWTPPDESTDKRLGNGRTSPPSSSSSHAIAPVSGVAPLGSSGVSGAGVGSLYRNASGSGSAQPRTTAIPSTSQRSGSGYHSSRGSPASVAPPAISVSQDPSPSQNPPHVSAPPAISVSVPSINVDPTASDDTLPSRRKMPTIPTISAPDVPSINIPEDDDSCSGGHPAISISVAPPSDRAPCRAVDVTPTNGMRPLPTPAGPGGSRPRQQPWAPARDSVRRSGMTICHECCLPIDGRFIQLGGSREKFHPGCFCCYTCNTNLEAMEISPEPEEARAERLERIRLRNSGVRVSEEPGKTAIDDGDDRLRFFCHLDWHEHYAPRCKHCKTPIHGEHIVALGSHWHYGHFFCAECGDPFEKGHTHIEKDGYAWCIKCQTKRTERRAPKCKKCKTAVIGQYIQALGGEWHDSCFKCATCDGSFDDGQIFPVERGGDTVVLCTQCRMRELKI